MNNQEFENKYHDLGYDYICGIDEAGRGPLAGPVVICGVVFAKDYYCAELNDSKKLSEKKREKLYDVIMKDALEVVVVIKDNEEIDRLNIYQATKKGMEEIVERLKKVDFVLTDAMKINTNKPYEAIIKGDARSYTIAAASIIAKVTRDRIMNEYHNKYPQYGFDKHKGYPTKAHLEAIEKYGILDIHRKTFNPINKKYQLLQLEI